MARKKKTRRQFRPQSHAAIYAVAVVYLGYLLIQMVRAAIAGGPDAPEALHLVLGVVVLGGGIVLLGFMIWRMMHLKPAENQQETTPGQQEEQQPDEEN
nr:hypothetical protein [uncultured Agathobaculum sp.]